MSDSMATLINHLMATERRCSSWWHLVWNCGARWTCETDGHAKPNLAYRWPAGVDYHCIIHARRTLLGHPVIELTFHINIISIYNKWPMLRWADNAGSVRNRKRFILEYAVKSWYSAPSLYSKIFNSMDLCHLHTMNRLIDHFFEIDRSWLDRESSWRELL